MAGVLLLGCGKKPGEDVPRRAPAEDEDPAASAPGPKVLFGQAEIEGPRSGDAVVEVARHNRDAMLACYTERLEAQPGLSGEVWLRFLVAPAGRVEDVVIHKNTLPDHTVATCMMRAANSWSFPASGDGEPTRINLPMHLRSK